MPHEVQEVALSDIKIEERQRSDVGEISELAASIEAHGLFHAPCVTRDLTLIAGFRRLMACKSLGWERLPVHVLEATDEIEVKEIELEENIRRKDLSWQERVKATDEIHALKKEKAGILRPEGEWTKQETANAVGMNRATVSVDVQLAKMMHYFPELEACKTRREAMKMLKELKLRTMRKEIAKRVEVVDEEIQVFRGDCVASMAGMADGIIDFINADPPFAIGLDDAAMFRESLNAYRDASSDILDLYRRFTPEAYRVLKPDRFMVFWFGITWYREVYQIISDAGFSVDPLPCIWDKQQHTFAPSTSWFAMGYEPFFVCRKGKRELFEKRRNVFNCSLYIKQKTIVGFPEKPLELMRELFPIFTLEGELILSPFAGSGVDLEAARELKRRAIGYELSESNYEAIVTRLSETDKGESND